MKLFQTLYSVATCAATSWRLARVAADRLFDHQISLVRAKCGNYMLEIFGTTIGLAWCANAGLFSLLFSPQNFDSPSTEQTLQFARGRAVQVDPMKSVLKPPGIKRLKLLYDKLFSNVAFKFNLRRYNAVLTGWSASPFASTSSNSPGRAVQVDSVKYRVESAYGFSA